MADVWLMLELLTLQQIRKACRCTIHIPRSPPRYHACPLSIARPHRAGLSLLRRDGPDRRRAPRFQVELIVELDHGTGLTRDVSVYGIFFVTRQRFSPGDPIECTLVFKDLDPDHPVRLHCLGQVVRVEPDDGNIGVAVAVTAYRMAPPA
jgi:PilZ domain